MKETVNYTHLNAGRFDSKNAQHRHILSLCMQIGWMKLNPKTKQPVADIERLGKFILESGYVKQPLRKYSTTEASKLIIQLGGVLKHRVS